MVIAYGSAFAKEVFLIHTVKNMRQRQEGEIHIVMCHLLVFNPPKENRGLVKSKQRIKHNVNSIKADKETKQLLRC